MPVRDLADMLEDPHLKETGFFERRNHPTEGAWYQMSPPVRYGCGFRPSQISPPLTGEHSGEIRDSLTLLPEKPTPSEDTP
jgi:crotonobetainyl-CoA:carnitine CoA-transferase CaiB-like acyl-CoA transferase